MTSKQAFELGQIAGVLFSLRPMLKEAIEDETFPARPVLMAVAANIEDVIEAMTKTVNDWRGTVE